MVVQMSQRNGVAVLETYGLLVDRCYGNETPSDMFISNNQNKTMMADQVAPAPEVLLRVFILANEIL